MIPRSAATACAVRLIFEAFRKGKSAEDLLDLIARTFIDTLGVDACTILEYSPGHVICELGGLRVWAILTHLSRLCR